MDPVIVQFGPFAIRWYGVMMAITILAGVWMAFRFGPRFGIPAAEIDRLTLPFILLAFIGARIGYVVSHPGEFGSLLETLRVDRGGLTSHGAIAGGLLAVWRAARRTGLPLWSYADATVWVIPLGNILVRFGNFVNGELYGDVTHLPWGVVFPGAAGARHPLQIYEMIWGAIILGAAVMLAGRRRFPGQIFWTVVVLTSMGRIFLDLLRSDDRVFGPLTLGHIPALALLVLGVLFLRAGSRAENKPTQPTQPTQSTQSPD